MSKTWVQTLLFTSLVIGGCCFFVAVGELIPWALGVAFFLLAATTVGDSMARKIAHLWLLAVLCWIAFILFVLL